MTVKVLSRDEVEIDGLHYVRSTIANCQPRSGTGHQICEFGRREILRLMDACEEPAGLVASAQPAFQVVPEQLIRNSQEPAPKEEKPSQETSENPANPFTGPHWQEENFTKDIVFNAWRRDCDLRDELTRIRELMAGKSVTP